MVTIKRLSGNELRAHITEISAVLADCVASGASVSFMPPFTQADSEGWFLQIADSVDRGERLVLAAFVDEALCGTVQAILTMPPNQPHRGEVAKLLVDRLWRGRGLARLLMEEAERQAIAEGKTLLLLDTADPIAEGLYARMGWVRLGRVPGFAFMPDGTLADTTFFWKAIRAGTD